MWKKSVAVASLCLALVAGMPGLAWANLVTNGSFDATTNGAGQLGYNTNATGWTTTGYNFLYASGTADKGGSVGQYGTVKLWGPGDGSNNGLPASSPDGGNFVAMDGAFGVQPLMQTITGLVVGRDYTVGFWWAGAQQYNFNGPTSDQLKVTFGNQTQATPVVLLAEHGFSGWMYQTFRFTASSASQALSFLSNGTPSGEPPFALLDGVSVNATVPEPSSMALVGIGLFAAGVARKVRRRPARA